MNYLKYDNQENIIYFSKEEIGFARDELILKYNSNMRVTNVIHSFSYSESLNKESLVYPDIKNIKFRYNELGIINSKSILQEDKSWLTYKYEIM
mgnify:CR=1 FL=1